MVTFTQNAYYYVFGAAEIPCSISRGCGERFLLGNIKAIIARKYLCRKVVVFGNNYQRLGPG